MKSFSNYIAVGLLCRSIEGTPSPLPDITSASTFPKLADNDSPTGSDIDGSFVNESWLKTSSNVNGPLYGFLNGYYVFPTQKIDAPTAYAGTGGEEAQIAAQGNTASSTRTFYQTDSAQLGSYPAKFTETTAANTDASAAVTLNAKNIGTFWVVCVDSQVGNAGNCPGSGATYFCASDGSACAKSATPKRVYQQSDNTTKPVYKTGTSAAVKWDYNKDFVIATFYQSDNTTADDVTDGTKWCNGFYTQLPAASTTVTKKATQGFNSKTKCTFQLVSETKEVAPVIKVTKLDYRKIFFGWIEWYNVAGMGSYYKLPGADGTDDTGDYKIGTYKVETTQKGLVWLNPVLAGLGTNEWRNSSFNPKVTDKNPVVTYPGSRSKVAGYFEQKGQFKEEQYLEFDDWVIDQMYYQQTMINNQYNSQKGDFDSKAETYNIAAKAETTRKGDFFKTTFEAAVSVPTRPCPPTQPMNWSGLLLDYARYVTDTKTWQATAADQKKYLGIVNTSGSSASKAKSNTFSQKLGYLRVAKDDTQFDKTTDQVSHTFGLLGQGDATDGIDGKAVPFKFEDTATDAYATLQITLSSAVKDQTGLDANTKFIEIEAKAVKWTNYDQYKAPSQPDGTKSLEKDPFASSALIKTASSMFAASVVLATLY